MRLDTGCRLGFHVVPGPLALGPLPSKGPNSPWSAGTRTLLARTCGQCGQLADGESFPVISGVGARRRACHLCVNASKKRDREERGIGVPAPRPPEELQTAKWRQWSAEDDRFLRENVGGMGYEAIAVALGRSVGSVYTRRRVLGLAPVRKRHRVAKPWTVRPQAPANNFAPVLPVQLPPDMSA